MYTTYLLGPYLFTVCEDDKRLETMEVDDLNGCCIANEQLILVRTGLPEDVAADVLLHELLHALFFVARIRTKDEEMVVDALAPVLLNALRQNPGILAALKVVL